MAGLNTGPLSAMDRDCASESNPVATGQAFASRQWTPMRQAALVAVGSWTPVDSADPAQNVSFAVPSPST